MPSSIQNPVTRLQSLGSLRIFQGARERRDLATRRLRCALLLYLGVEGRATRDELMTLLWPEREPERARHSLSQALYELRQDLGTDQLDVDGDWIRTTDRVEVDTRHFADSVAEGDHETALTLYQGPFLAGVHLVDSPVFDSWTQRIRSRLAHLHRRARSEVVTACRSAGRDAEALSTAMEWVAHDPLDDEAQHALVELLYERGLRSEALRAYEEYRELLAAELGVEPMARTRRLVAEMRAERTMPAPEPEASRTPGLTEELAPRLEIVRTLGEGSMATVYLARDRALRRLVALKVLKPEVAADPTSRSRFEREARSQARISHRNVAAVHTVGVLSDGTPFAVLEYVAGRTLRAHLEARGSLDCDEVRCIVSQVAAGLEAAHERNVVHRDVRPSNILIEEGSGRAVLSDFGLAALLATGEDPGPRLTRTGEVVGNPVYVSPEILAGEPATSAADVYSLGMLACELLISTRRRSGPMAMAQVIRTGARLDSFRPDLPPRTAELVQRCLAQDPHHRPSAGRVVGVLENGEAVTPTARLEPLPEEPSVVRFLNTLKDRRVIPAIGAVLGASYFGFEAVTQLVEDGLAPAGTTPLLLVLLPFALAATTVVAWFHGEKGPQRVPEVELWILAGLGVFWLAATGAVLVLA